MKASQLLAALSRAPNGPPRAPALAERPYHVAVATAAAGLGLAEARLVLVVAIAAGCFAALACLRAPQLGGVAAALVLAGASVGGLRLVAIDGAAGHFKDGSTVDLRAYLGSAPRQGLFGASAEIEVAGGRLDGARLLLRIPRWSPLPTAARPGAELRLHGRIRAVGSDAFADQLRRRGIAGELLLDRARLTGRRRGGAAGLLDRMRERAEDAVVAGMGPGEAALLRGMVLGQDERISEAVREDFRASGLAHLLAVSGQNVMLLAALALPLLILAGLGVRARLFALAVLIALYVPLAGAGPSLQRAGVMGIAGIAAMAASRPASRSYALLLAAAVTLAWNPRAWADPGWQLSFAAVAGILGLGLPLGRVLRRGVEELLPCAPSALRRGANGLAEGMAITIAATVATAPLLGHHFGSVTPAGLLANLLALPAVAPAMWLGMLKIALGQVGAPGFLAAALGAPAAIPVGVIAWLAERFADLSFARVSLPLASPVAVTGAYGAIAVGALGLRHAARALTPRALEGLSRWRRLPRATRVGLAAAVGAAIVLSIGWLLRTPGAPDRLTVRFLDVGQGDATLIQHPDGTAILFDGGPPEAGVARLLRRAGVRRLALVVATHASRDHQGGLVEVLRRFPVDSLLDGGDGTHDAGFRAVLREAAARGVRRIRATAPLALTLAGGGLRIAVLSPEPRPPGPQPEDPNPRGVVAIVSSGWFDLFLSADAESEALIPLDLPDVDAMKVPHHGSSDPGLPEVLDELEPQLAAIEVGPNTYGHPTASTLRALRNAGVITHRTDREGTVTLTIDEKAMRVQTER
ncbi:MAG TPA: ComEC/Rec2 family competence protein [Thermoleophilaceae bacterium]|nr:ComEC/Rec2 family competence protein [Thermoleophilaceae bacterium]